MRLILPPSIAACLIGALLTSAPAAAQDNRPPAGFVALFNGKDLTGWQGLVELPQRAKLTPEDLKKAQQDANDKYLPHWTVRDGVLHYDGKGQSLQTAKDYQDFELLVDWKIGPKGDTGIYLRGTPQVQIWDRAEGSGGLYNNQKNPRNPIKNADKPVGEWNTFRIVMRGEIVTIWLNGELVVDKVPMENYWDRTQPIAPTGPIELQHHGNPIEFKNVYIRELK
jgi:hypothetical protein